MQSTVGKAGDCAATRVGHDPLRLCSLCYRSTDVGDRQALHGDGAAVDQYRTLQPESEGLVNHYLLGLGVTQPKLDKVTGEAGEAIDDLRNIAQLGYDEDEDQEELEMSLEEIIEYVRVAALLCHDNFTRSQPTAPEVRKPTLH